MNLEYVRTAKRLNSRQARWSLFFTRFNFSLSYRPESRNIKPDALSRQFQEIEDAIPGHVPILSAPSMVATLTWEIEERVRSAMEFQPSPNKVPRYCLFVSSSAVRCPPVGSFLQAFLSSGNPENQGRGPATFLVSHSRQGHPGVCQCLSGLQSTQVILAGSCWFPAAPPCSSSSLVSHLSGLPPSEGNRVIVVFSVEFVICVVLLFLISMFQSNVYVKTELKMLQVTFIEKCLRFSSPIV